VSTLNLGAKSDAQSGAERERAAADLSLDRKRFEQKQEFLDLRSKFSESQARLNLARELEKIQDEKLTHERARLQRGREGDVLRGGAKQGARRRSTTFIGHPNRRQHAAPVLNRHGRQQGTAWHEDEHRRPSTRTAVGDDTAANRKTTQTKRSPRVVVGVHARRRFFHARLEHVGGLGS
jgi:hypothetical protein